MQSMRSANDADWNDCGRRMGRSTTALPIEKPVVSPTKPSLLHDVISTRRRSGLPDRTQGNDGPRFVTYSINPVRLTSKRETGPCVRRLPRFSRTRSDPSKPPLLQGWLGARSTLTMLMERLLENSSVTHSLLQSTRSANWLIRCRRSPPRSTVSRHRSSNRSPTCSRCW